MIPHRVGAEAALAGLWLAADGLAWAEVWAGRAASGGLRPAAL
jgi:hypothetical protein